MGAIERGERSLTLDTACEAYQQAWRDRRLHAVRFRDRQRRQYHSAVSSDH